MILPLGRVPPFGWWFDVAPGVTIKAVTREKLFEAISEYRVRNGLPPGDIEREVNDSYCERYPSACVKEAHELGRSRGEFPRSESLTNRVGRWATGLLQRMPSGGYQLVGAQEAERRGRICANCPKNTAWRGSCGGCTRSAVTVMAQIRKLNHTPVDGSLMACVVTGYGLETAVWLDRKELDATEDQLNAMPGNCWRKA